MTVIGVMFDLQQDGDFRLMNVLENVIDPAWYWRFGGGENYIRNSTSDPWDLFRTGKIQSSMRMN